MGTVRGSFCFQVAFEQRVASVVKRQPRAAVATWSVLLRIVFKEANWNTTVVFGEACFGELQFQFGEHFGSCENRIGADADALRHLQQDAVNLGLFFVKQAHQFVVLLDGFERLDENGLPAGTGSVNHALDAAFLFDFDGNNETLATDGDQFVLDSAAFRQPAEITTQRFLNEAFLFFDIAADAG